MIIDTFIHPITKHKYIFKENTVYDCYYWYEDTQQRTKDDVDAINKTVIEEYRNQILKFPEKNTKELWHRPIFY